MRAYILDRIHEAESVRQALASDEQLLQTIEQITDVLWDTVVKGGSIFFCGNGGSAADAQHLATELSGRFLVDRRAIKAEALGTNMAFTTAIANDYAFDKIYARSLEALGRAGDVLVLLSTSGSSPNIVAAAAAAPKMQVKTVAMTGAKGSQLVENCDYGLVVPSSSVPRIQEAHMLIGHIICEALEQRLVDKKSL